MKLSCQDLSHNYHYLLLHYSRGTHRQSKMWSQSARASSLSTVNAPSPSWAQPSDRTSGFSHVLLPPRGVRLPVSHAALLDSCPSPLSRSCASFMNILNYPYSQLPIYMHTPFSECLCNRKA